MAIALLAGEIVSAVLSADTLKALALIQDYQDIFSDPVQGLAVHAEILYGAIKKANTAVVEALLALPVHSDLSFFKFCGTTPLSAAIESGHEELFPVLLSRTDKYFALHMALKFNVAKTLNFLLDTCFFSQKFLRLLGL